MFPEHADLTVTVLYGKASWIFGQNFGIWDFFRWDFNGFVDDCWGDFCRTFGGVLICFSYSVGCFMEEFR